MLHCYLFISSRMWLFCYNEIIYISHISMAIVFVSPRAPWINYSWILHEWNWRYFQSISPFRHKKICSERLVCTRTKGIQCKPCVCNPASNIHPRANPSLLWNWRFFWQHLATVSRSIPPIQKCNDHLIIKHCLCAPLYKDDPPPVIFYQRPNQIPGVAAASQAHGRP